MTSLLSVTSSQGMTFGLTTPTKSASSSGSSNGSPSQQPPPYKVPKFLRSLYSILQHEEGGIVRWVQNEELKPNRVTAFHILDLDRFENVVLPKYFKHSKFASFQRQLNNFGFRKWTKTQSSGVCTFSHNCFPPDPREIGVLRASIREQWRQKTDDTRRRVGNGITKAERKLQQQVQQQVQQLQTTGTKTGSPGPSDTSSSCSSDMGSPSRVESFSAMLKMPLTANLETSFPRAPTHQPQVKKLARGDWASTSTSGLEAFGDHAGHHHPIKQGLLPPLQTAQHQQQHQLPHVSYNNTINIGTYTPPHHHHQEVSIYATTAQQQQQQSSMKMDMAQPPTTSMMIPSTQLEPWAWNPHAASTSYYSVDAPPHAWASLHHHHDASAAHKGGVYGHTALEQQASPSTMEEFTFDHLLLFTE